LNIYYNFSFFLFVNHKKWGFNFK